MTHMDAILAAYTSGAATLEETNRALQAAGTGLRLDPDSEGGVTSCLSAVTLNPAEPLWRRLIPDAGTLLVLAAAPLLLAALAGELTELDVPLDKKRR